MIILMDILEQSHSTTRQIALLILVHIPLVLNGMMNRFIISQNNNY